jgi:aminopeptidase N
VRRAAAALALGLAAAAPLHAQAAAPLAERAAPPRLTVGILGYRFTITLPDSGDTITGRAAIRVRRLRAGVPDTVPLDLVALAVREVLDDAGRPLAASYDGRVLRAVLPPAPRPGAGTITVTYSGRPVDGLIVATSAGGRRVVFADDWPDRARGFIPCVDHPAFKAPVTWEIEAPAAMRVVANGALESVRDAPGRRRRWVYVETRPIPTYTMVFGAAPFAVSRHPPAITGRDTTATEVWTYPEDSAFADSVPFRRATAIVEVGSRIIGPFPWRKLAHVESSTRFGGMENSAAIFYADGMYVGRHMSEGVVRHETAHQWFGDAVTERDWRHLWLSEGFATYFDLVFAAALGDDSVLAQGMRREARGYFASDVVGRPVVDAAAEDLMGLLNANSYNKGAWVLRMLRGEVGDSAFFRGIRRYYAAFRDSSVLSEDFERVMERAAGRDLRWFFRQWLYQPGYPRLDVAWQAGDAGRRVTLRVHQAQPALWGRFRLPRVAVRFTAAGGAADDRSLALDPALAEQTFTFTLPRAPTGVAIDPEGRLLMTAEVRRADGPDPQGTRALLRRN